MNLLFLTLVSFAGVFSLIVLIQPLALRLGLVDIPDARKIHKQSTEKIGGLAIALFIIPYLYIQNPRYGMFDYTFYGLLFFSCLSFIDDIRALSGFTQLACQTLIAFIVVHLGGLSVHHLGSIIPGYADLILSPIYRDIFSVFALVGLINALNMIDGIDGLLGSLALILNFIFLGLGFYYQIEIVVILSVLMIGALFAFLYFNFPKKTPHKHLIFLGDIGSSFIGFIFYWMTIELTRSPENSVPPIMLVWCLALPLLDMLRVMITRLYLKKMIMAPDQLHLHYILLAKGWSTQYIIGLGVSSTLIFTAIGSLALFNAAIQPYLFFGFWVMFIFYERWIKYFK